MLSRINSSHSFHQLHDSSLYFHNLSTIIHSQPNAPHFSTLYHRMPRYYREIATNYLWPPLCPHTTQSHQNKNAPYSPIHPNLRSPLSHKLWSIDRKLTSLLHIDRFPKPDPSPTISNTPQCTVKLGNKLKPHKLWNHKFQSASQHTYLSSSHTASHLSIETPFIRSHLPIKVTPTSMREMSYISHHSTHVSPIPYLNSYTSI